MAGPQGQPGAATRRPGCPRCGNLDGNLRFNLLDRSDRTRPLRRRMLDCGACGHRWPETGRAERVLVPYVRGNKPMSAYFPVAAGRRGDGARRRMRGHDAPTGR